MKRHNLFTIFFLALMLVIRPVFAENLMVPQQNTLQAETTHNAAMHAMHTDMPHHHMQHHSDNVIDATCYDQGVHYCQMDCSDNNCNLISSSPVVQTVDATSSFSAKFNIENKPINTVFRTRSISPELRPPLV